MGFVRAGLAYGEPWAQGDVIGCALDLDVGTVSFLRNGVHLGVAFEGVRRPLAYFPAASLSYGAACDGATASVDIVVPPNLSGSPALAISKHWLSVLLTFLLPATEICTACTGERCEFNFGAWPMAFPLEGHHPLQEPPGGCGAAQYLLGCLKRVVTANLACCNAGGQVGNWVRRLEDPLPLAG